MTTPQKLVRIHVAPRIPGKTLVALVNQFEGRDEGKDALFYPHPRDLRYDGFMLESGPEEADYILAPHAVRFLDKETIQYIEGVRRYATGYGKPLIIFATGDYHHAIFLDDVLLLKGSQYRYLKRDNEILIPSLVQDLSEQTSFVARKKSARPVVGFCGYASFPSMTARIKYILRNFGVDAWALLSLRPHLKVLKRGLYWRRKSMRLLAADSRIETRFIVRTTFSGSAHLVSLDPARARREYIENLRDCDFALAPKGDANFSLRFYEALSMGRIPILIDTETVLPLEGIVNYDDFILRVPYQRIDQLADIVADFYANLSEEKFEAMQRAAHAAFEQHLRYDAFFNTLFTRVLTGSVTSEQK